MPVANDSCIIIGEELRDIGGGDARPALASIAALRCHCAITGRQEVPAAGRISRFCCRAVVAMPARIKRDTRF